MKQTNQPVINLILLFILTIAAGVLFFVTQQQQATVRLLSAEVGQLDINRQRLIDVSDSLPSLSLETRNWLKTLPGNEMDIAAFAGELERIARRELLTFDLNLDDFPGPVDVSGRYIDGLGSQITLIGSFSGVTAFIAELTDIPYFFKVDKIAITKTDSQPGVKTVINGAIMMNLEKNL